MSHQLTVLINKLHYTTPNNHSLFNDLTLSFGQNKTAIVGRNGIGKTTLLRLIANEITPTAGSIKVSGTIAHCPQNFITKPNHTVADILGVSEKINALEKILSGHFSEKEYAALNEEWDIKEKTDKQLKQFGLEKIHLKQSADQLSGGEITRLLLVKVFLSNADFTLLDEPTNNIDKKSRELFYEIISQWYRGLILVSHDRTLLDLMDYIIELTTLGAKEYSGNYTHYLSQKESETNAAHHALHEAKKQEREIKKALQQTYEKHVKRESKGEKARKKGGQTKLILNSMKSRSEKSANKLSIKKERLIDETKQKVNGAREKIEITNEIKIDIPKTAIPQSKIILKLDEVSFAYDSKILFNHFNLTLQGPERIAITGDNGSGKTTLAKLIQGKIKPDSGNIYLGTQQIAYLDQCCVLLNESLSIYNNYRLLNPDISEKIARINLARFLFRNDDALKLVEYLSGGEKLRAALACLLTSKTPPQLLIIDEPTNHLDFESIQALESALNCYQGALIVISHDERFLKNIKVTRQIICKI